MSCFLTGCQWLPSLACDPPADTPLPVALWKSCGPFKVWLTKSSLNFPGENQLCSPLCYPKAFAFHLCITFTPPLAIVSEVLESCGVPALLIFELHHVTSPKPHKQMDLQVVLQKRSKNQTLWTVFREKWQMRKESCNIFTSKSLICTI